VFDRLQITAPKIIAKILDTAASVFNWPADQLRLFFLSFSVKHVHGLTSHSLSQREAVVLCVVKDGESLVAAFIEHYLQLGFKHIFFLDNGSTDQTAEIIKSYSQTTLLLSDKPFCNYYVIFKNFLIQKFGDGKWCVLADIDEFLYFPLNKTLPEILAYLNERNYDSLCIQMLDVFSREGIQLKAVKPVENTKVWTLNNLKTTFCYYDLSNLDKRQYIRRFQPKTHPNLKFLYGGIRKTVFGRDCFLTKEAIFFAHKKTYLKSSHLLRNSKIADFSALFLHYKFIDSFYSSTIKAVELQNHWRQSEEYKAYLSVIEQQKPKNKAELILLQSSSLSFIEIEKGIDDLIDSDFLFVSDEFRAFFNNFVGA
jgi:glycosyltransferase involved in cell wall biosynthesis